MKKSDSKKTHKRKKNLLIVLILLCIDLLLLYYLTSPVSTGNVSLNNKNNPDASREKCGSGPNVNLCQVGESCCPAGKYTTGGNTQTGQLCCNTQNEKCGYSILAKLYYCDRICNSKTEEKCGPNCCNKKTEICASQAGGGGFCIPKSRQCSSSQTPCTNGTSPDVLACCNSGEKCENKTIQGAVPGLSKLPFFGNAFKGSVTVYGCTAEACPSKNGKTYSICKSSSASKLSGYNVCCADETETCELQPSGLARCVPKCATPPKITLDTSPSSVIALVTKFYYIKGYVKDGCTNKPMSGYSVYSQVVSYSGETATTTSSNGAFTLGPFAPDAYRKYNPYGGLETQKITLTDPGTSEELAETNLSICVLACNDKKVCPIYTCAPLRAGEYVEKSEQCYMANGETGKKTNIRSVAEVSGSAAARCNLNIPLPGPV